MVSNTLKTTVSPLNLLILMSDMTNHAKLTLDLTKLPISKMSLLDLPLLLNKPLAHNLFLLPLMLNLGNSTAVESSVTAELLLTTESY